MESVARHEEIRDQMLDSTPRPGCLLTISALPLACRYGGWDSTRRAYSTPNEAMHYTPRARYRQYGGIHE